MKIANKLTESMMTALEETKVENELNEIQRRRNIKRNHRVYRIYL